MALPSGMKSKVKEIVTADGNLEDKLDISRGDMIVRKNNLPTVDTRFDATLSWMDEEKSLPISNHYMLQ